jgi:hypothetical protein
MEIFSQQAKTKKNSIITPEVVQLIFGNLPTILNFHKEILLSMEETDITKQKPTVEQRRNQLIKVILNCSKSKTFEKIIPVLPLYKPYVATFHKSQTKLTELVDHKKFLEILEVPFFFLLRILQSLQNLHRWNCLNFCFALLIESQNILN